MKSMQYSEDLRWNHCCGRPFSGAPTEGFIPEVGGGGRREARKRKEDGVMRVAGILGVLCFAAAPVLASPVTYTFDLTSGMLDIGIEGIGSTTSGLDGTFAVTIYQSNCHIGESDTFIVEDAFLYNTESVLLAIGGLVTAHVDVLSARFVDFMPDGCDHIGPGGVASVDTDVAVEVTAVVTGGYSVTFQTATSSGMLLPFTISFTTSGLRSDIVTAGIGFTYGWEIGIPDITLTITLDLVIDAVGTAHVVPDPALGGLTALGLGGAGAWLRRRR